MSIRYLSGIDVDSNTLFVDSANDRVGIGTATPGNKLDVVGAPTTNDWGLRLQNTNTGGWGVSQFFNIYGYASSPASDFSALQIRADYPGYGRTSFVVKEQAQSSALESLVLRGNGQVYMNAGNVGIGTTAPEQKLHVAGNISIRGIEGGTYGSLRFGTNNSTYYDAWAGIDSDWEGVGINVSNLRFYTSYGSRSERMRITSSGNVGIGNTSPNGALSFADDVNTRKIVLWDGAANNNYQFYGLGVESSTFINSIYDTTDRFLWVAGSGSTSRSEVMVLTGTGRLGIGTTIPASILQLGAGPSIPTNAAYNSFQAGSFGVLFRDNYDSYITFNTTYSTSGWLNKYNGLKSGVIQITDGRFSIDLGTGTVGGAASDLTERFVILNNGNVGIGTASPAFKLDVSGTFHSGGDATFNGTNTYINSSYIYVGNNTADLVSISGNTMYFPGNGNVGIGTTAPSGKLDVSASAGSYIFNLTNADEEAFKLRSYNGGTTSLSVPAFTYGLYYNTQENTSIKFYRGESSVGGFMTFTTNDGSERMRITSGGNVGIGTTAPASKLNVAGGNVTVSAGYGIAWSGDQSRIMTPEDNVSGALIQYGSGAIMRFVNGTTEHVRINGSGNLGIGTTAPNAKLDVAGGINTRNTRVNSAEKYPVGHYSFGETVFEIDPTWTEAQLQDFFNVSGVSWVADSTAPGGYAIQIDGSANVGAGEYDSGFPYIPVDNSQDDWYYMECYIKNDAGSSIQHYMGGIDFNQNFASLGGNPGSYTYNVMFNYNPGTSWTKVYGYWNGFGSSYGSAGTGNTNNWVSGTKYFTPQALFNYGLNSGIRRCYISGWKCVRVRATGNRYYSNNVLVSGNVGIGTTAPSSRLHLSGTSTSITVTDTTYNRTSSIGYLDSANLYFANDPASNTFIGAYNGVFLAYGGGNAGIGTTSPTEKLHVNGNAVLTYNNSYQGINSVGNKAILARVSPTTGIINYAEYATAANLNGFVMGSDDARVKGNIATDSLEFITNASERMRITSAGNVGIGTSSPSNILHITNVMRMDNVSASSPNLSSTSAPKYGYGDVSNDRYLAEPVIWLKINVGGTEYVIPGYTEVI